MATLLFCLLVFAFAAQAVSAHAYPSWPMPKTWQPPKAWLREAMCVHRHESVDWYRRWTNWQGHRSPYAGGLQFLQDTWNRAGGSGEPWQASPREQLYRAYIIWDRHVGKMGDGRGNWSEWGTARACGLR